MAQSHAVRDGLCVVSGYGVRIAVHHGQLEVADGFPGEQRTMRLHRATSKLKRFVVLGHTGTVSLEALRWLHDVGAAFVHIDADGRMLSLSAPVGRDDARLRRAQALAPLTGLGLVIAKDLIRRKLEGQRQVLNAMPESDSARATVATSLDSFDTARDVNELRVLEAASAGAYWSAWSSIGMRFAQSDQPKVPEHWLQFEGRSSPITSSPRRAADPINALLNYLYALLESECRIALLTLGLDPGMGVMHFDQRGRDSLALDLMEAVRPQADQLVLELVQSRTFSAREFFETRTGDCRLVAPLPELLSDRMAVLRGHVAPVAETLALAFAASIRSSADWRPESGAEVFASRKVPTLATPLTEDNRIAGRSGVRSSKGTRTQSRARRLAGACTQCGAALSGVKRQFCDECLVPRLDEVRTEFAAAGPAALARLRAEGNDPTATKQARSKLSASRRKQQELNDAWERDHGEKPSPQLFVRDILPKLEGVPLTVMMAATGLSVRQCSRIRRGEQIPHPRHWDGLLEAAQRRATESVVSR